MCCLRCKNTTPEATVIRAVQAASETLVQPVTTSLIRNGGWEGAFRNEVMFALEKQNQQLLGFTEGSDGETVRVDLMIHCMECKQSKLKFGIETKINFYTQRASEIVKQLEDGFAKAARLAGSTARSRVFLVHAVADLWYVGENVRAAQHNNVVSKRSYKRFLDHDPRIDRNECSQKPVKRWIFKNAAWKPCENVCSHPEESTLSVPEEGQSVSGTRLRVWVAQVIRKNEDQYQLKFMRKDESCNQDKLLSGAELKEILARNSRVDRKPICWSTKQPTRKPRQQIQ